MPVVAVRPIELEHRELGVVLGRKALVAEVAVDLVDPVHAADQEALQVELGGDAQVEIEVESVVVGDERTRHGAAGNHLHHRRLDLEEAATVEEGAHAAHDACPDLEHPPRLGIRHQIEIALAVAALGIGEAVPLFGQRPQGLGEQRQALRRDRELADAGAQELALGEQVVAEIERAEQLVGGHVEEIPPDEELKLRGAVVEVHEQELPLLPDGADSPRHAQPDFLRRELLGALGAEPCLHSRRLEIVIATRGKGIDAPHRQFGAFPPAIGDLLVELRHRTRRIPESCC